MSKPKAPENKKSPRKSTKKTTRQRETPPVPSYPQRTGSVPLLSDVKFKPNSLTIPFRSHAELSAKLARISTTLADAHLFGATPDFTVAAASPDVLPDDTASQIVESCTGASDFSLSVAECRKDANQVESCIARKLRNLGFQVPAQLSVTAASCLWQIFDMIQGATK